MYARMRAILLAAGYGSRLLPLTSVTPKCLVPIHGRPLLDVWLERLTAAGIGPLLINTHYLPGQVEQFLSNSHYGPLVTVSHEAELLGTAGTLLNNIAFYGNCDGMLIHADNYCLADLSEFVACHKERPAGCVMTMLTYRANNPSHCGVVELNKENIVTGFYEKVVNPPGNLANGAIYILSAEFFHEMLLTTPCFDFSADVIPNLLGRIFTYETKETFIDIGTPESYDAANQLSNN